MEVVPFFDVRRQRIGVFWRRVLHTAHHRTQLTVYLRMLGKEVPAVYGPTADVKWERRRSYLLSRGSGKTLETSSTCQAGSSSGRYKLLIISSIRCNKHWHDFIYVILAIVCSMKVITSAKANLSFQDVHYVFLDRDGVINRKPPEGEYVGHWSGFQLLPGAESAIAALNRAGRRVIVITNQRGVALGRYTCTDVETLHSQLQEHLEQYGARIDAFYYCPHDKNQCDCRKPKTGLFQQAFRDFPDASTANSLVIGDSISDIEAARNLWIPAIFIQGDPETQKPGAETAAKLADAVCDSLADAVALFLD